jgi:hypothetical protein
VVDDWLSTTRKIQTEIYGRDPASLEGLELQQFLHWNHSAAVVELSEAIEETRWKPWAILEKDEPVIPNKAIFASECVDALMFIANMLVAAGVSDEEFQVIYRAKWEKNISRQQQAGGYISKKGIDKCTSCGRALDDVGESVDAPGHCVVCWPEVTANV